MVKPQHPPELGPGTLGALQPASRPLLGDSSHGHVPVMGGRWRPRCCPAIGGARCPGALGVQGAGPALLGLGSTREDQGAPCPRAGGRGPAEALCRAPGGGLIVPGAPRRLEEPLTAGQPRALLSSRPASVHAPGHAAVCLPPTCVSLSLFVRRLARPPGDGKNTQAAALPGGAARGGLCFSVPHPPQPGSSLGLLPPSQATLKTKTEKQGWCLGGAGPRPSSCLMALTREATLG